MQIMAKGHTFSPEFNYFMSFDSAETLQERVFSQFDPSEMDKKTTKDCRAFTRTRASQIAKELFDMMSKGVSPAELGKAAKYYYQALQTQLPCYCSENARNGLACQKEAIDSLSLPFTQTLSRHDASDDLFFPSKDQIVACLKEHPLTSDPYFTEKKITDSVASFFAHEDRVPEGVDLGVMLTLEDLHLDLGPHLRFKNFVTAVSRATQDCDVLHTSYKKKTPEPAAKAVETQNSSQFCRTKRESELVCSRTEPDELSKLFDSRVKAMAKTPSDDSDMLSCDVMGMPVRCASPRSTERLLQVTASLSSDALRKAGHLFKELYQHMDELESDDLI